MVEHAAVNRGVVGSSPTRGGRLKTSKACFQLEVSQSETSGLVENLL